LSNSTAASNPHGFCWKVNCSGNERGAFTGAIAQKVGRLELQTEVRCSRRNRRYPLELQPKLLAPFAGAGIRGLCSTPDAREVRRSGGSCDHRDLEGMIVRSSLRSDLLYV